MTVLEANLPDHERIPGREHPRTVGSRHNLAAALRASDDLPRALARSWHALGEARRVLGDGHPATRAARSRFASLRRGLAALPGPYHAVPAPSGPP
ncbi:hypothetical protein GCM10020367_60390 [Streptomyces sannanensis]|uniref:Tetratricopeptide repeat protein n=1 Tax=Streptomyces sannanensis TaxID=285536 RepID=A0ABP6SK33_9ACTN